MQLWNNTVYDDSLILQWKDYNKIKAGIPDNLHKAFFEIQWESQYLLISLQALRKYGDEMDSSSYNDIEELYYEIKERTHPLDLKGRIQLKLAGVSNGIIGWLGKQGISEYAVEALEREIKSNRQKKALRDTLDRIVGDTAPDNPDTDTGGSSSGDDMINQFENGVSTPNGATQGGGNSAPSFLSKYKFALIGIALFLTAGALMMRNRG